MATQLATVKKFATKHNLDYVNQFESSVTHVIVNTTGEKNAAKSTLKFLQGIAHRKWIVSYRWIEDCIEQEKLLDETPYEATTFTDGIIDDGPQRSRLRKKDLFEDFTFWCVGPYLNVSLNQYQVSLWLYLVSAMKNVRHVANLSSLIRLFLESYFSCHEPY